MQTPLQLETATASLSGALRFEQIAEALESNLSTVLAGKPEAIRAALVCLFAGGHLLIDDVPGVGKTSLARGIAQSMGGAWRRIQFTPDLLPSDITGSTVWDRDQNAFEFRPGAVFANVVLADEINRAAPKTQSALLEAMEEAQVTADGATHALPTPFMVIATQNPVETDGTFPLPEAQLDRFLMRISIGYPTRDASMDILANHDARLAPEVPAVASPRVIMGAVAACEGITVHDAIRAYVIDIVEETRDAPGVRLGASPRAALALQRAARAQAALAGRNFVLPDDVKELAVPVLAHRILMEYGTSMSPIEVINSVILQVPTPHPAR
ncbi:MAG: AAA family ATPase [Acidimicrobiia bacterium]